MPESLVELVPLYPEEGEGSLFISEECLAAIDAEVAEYEQARREALQEDRAARGRVRP